jgi:hypothetical protein
MKAKAPENFRVDYASKSSLSVCWRNLALFFFFIAISPVSSSSPSEEEALCIHPYRKTRDRRKEREIPISVALVLRV